GKQIHSMIIKEKSRIHRHIGARRSKSPPLNPGQISVAVPDKDIPLSTGGHIYEEMPILQLKTQDTKSPPGKPSRLSTHLSRKEETSILSKMNKVKSHPTGIGQGTPRSPLQPRAESFRTSTVAGACGGSEPLVSSSPIYSEVVDFKDAWKTYGTGDDCKSRTGVKEKEISLSNNTRRLFSH
ncbi:hypothetical protein SK128_027605, partial [Halocaridina rubra]